MCVHVFQNSEPLMSVARVLRVVVVPCVHATRAVNAETPRFVMIAFPCSDTSLRQANTEADILIT